MNFYYSYDRILNRKGGIHMNGILKKIAYTSLMQDIILLLFAVILLSMQSVIYNIIAIFIGAFFIFKGIVEICRYAIAKGLSEFYKTEIIYGVVSILLGILVIIARSFLGWVINTCIAIYIIYGAIKNFDVSMRMKRLNMKPWIMMLIISVVMLLFGLYVFLNRNLLVNMYAIYLIIFAIMDLIESILFIICSKKIFD